MEYTGKEKWTEFRKCLASDVLTTWDEVVEEDYACDATRLNNAFDAAIKKSMKKLLNCDYPRDVQYTFMTPNGGIPKDPFQLPEVFARRWKTMLRVTM